MNMKKTDQCDEFTQFKSSIDYQSHGCTQTGKTYITQGSFGKTIIPTPVTLTLNCSLIEPSYYFGCALIEKNFTGCSAQCEKQTFLLLKHILTVHNKWNITYKCTQRFWIYQIII
ncbi:unnamed protein product [Paramecium primaurelia]|uniref:Uncharacterized protein n=1 Tax=Paramecium primaurelia TaxID=5886 RepID=A0A8S1QSQ1_PARPR|nr:unnamed protein product [Paramecium primaurelia]